MDATSKAGSGQGLTCSSAKAEGTTIAFVATSFQSCLIKNAPFDDPLSENERPLVPHLRDVKTLAKTPSSEIRIITVFTDSRTPCSGKPTSMAFPQHMSLSSPLSPSRPFSLLFKASITSPKLPFKTSRVAFKVLAWSYSSPMATEQAMLEAVAQTEGNSLPCVRSYENDMARLSLAGAVGFEQALTAAAADGGEAATEHINSRLSAMVVETVFPGPDDEHSTVSTRLFLPARKVKEKARKLRSSLSEDILSSTNSRNILAMTFRQVVMQKLWNFELVVFVPGSQRNMDDLGSLREQVAASFSLSSSDEKVISRLAEAVCTLALDSMQEEFLRGSSGKTLDGFFNWFPKPKQFMSKDSSVVIFRYADEIVENSKSLLDRFNMVRAKFTLTNKKLRRSAWPSLMHSKLEKIGGSEFSAWASEYVPAYRIEIDADRLPDLQFEGWKRTMENKWEVFLTHSQMVGLANIVDMYFEDVYTLPTKQLSCDGVKDPKKLSKMQGFSLFGFLRTILVTASFLLSVGVIVKLRLPHLYTSIRRVTGEHHVLASSGSDDGEVKLPSSEASEVI
ncbi:hypothetical protein Cgig2_018986 [Carnegiea gigantea]|uniref:Uncharacterized protein n=1 Tax=Carnegiea gigantea TaxID=171969 RepID=A0A9Q1GWH3_9CARY|nr:hypothetical protein Cgig2_018986 [Carnegiea gigantea]